MNTKQNLNLQRLIFRKPIIAVVVSVAVLVLAGKLYFHHGYPIDLTQEDIQLLVASKSVFDTCPMAPASDTAAVESGLAEAQTIPDQLNTVTPSDDIRSRLYYTIAKWISFRAAIDPDGFARWMRSRGCTLFQEIETADDALPYDVRAGRRAEFYEFYTGQNIPPDLSAVAYHDLIFAQSLKCLGKEALRPVSVVLGRGLAIVIRRNDSRESVLPLKRWDGAELWIGNAAGGGTQLWKPPVSFEELLARDSGALTAVVLLTTRSRHGAYVPLSLTLYYDPPSQEWFFMDVTLSNTEDYRCGAGVY